MGYAERYAIGLKMDEATAARLFPCMVDLDLPPDNACAKTPIAKAWPVSLSLELIADGRDVTKALEPETATSGGEYEGTETYRRAVAYANMRPGVRYRLLVHSVSDGTSLRPAKPHLVVAVQTPGFGDQKALVFMATLAVAAILALLSITWAGFILWRAQRHS